MLDFEETISHITIFRERNRIHTLKCVNMRVRSLLVRVHSLLARVHACHMRFSGSVFLIGTVFEKFLCAYIHTVCTHTGCMYMCMHACTYVCTVCVYMYVCTLCTYITRSRDVDLQYASLVTCIMWPSPTAYPEQQWVPVARWAWWVVRALREEQEQRTQGHCAFCKWLNLMWWTYVCTYVSTHWRSVRMWQYNINKYIVIIVGNTCVHANTYIQASEISLSGIHFSVVTHQKMHTYILSQVLAL